MKKQVLSVIFLVTVAFMGCKNNLKNNVLKDAKKAAELECSKKDLMQKARSGDLSALDDETRLSEELALLKKKYGNNESQNLEFVEAFNKEMLNCKTKEVVLGEDVEIVSGSTSANEDWDKMLDDFEAYTDDYIKLYKKTLAGDSEAIADYPVLLEKAESLQKSIEKAQHDNQLSSAQVKRLLAI